MEQEFDHFFKDEQFLEDIWQFPILNADNKESLIQQDTDIWKGDFIVSTTDFNELSDSDCVGNSSDEEPVMEKFPAESVCDLKHIIYNLLVEHHNHPTQPSLIQPFQLTECGLPGIGFRFVESQKPELRLPELYSQYIRKARLDLADPDCIFTQDLYRFYLRACLELLSKYFKKLDKWTYLFYENEPLFVPGLTLEEAEIRVRNHRTIQRKRKKDVLLRELEVEGKSPKRRIRNS